MRVNSCRSPPSIHAVLVFTIFRTTVCRTENCALSHAARGKSLQIKALLPTTKKPRLCAARLHRMVNLTLSSSGLSRTRFDLISCPRSESSSRPIPAGSRYPRTLPRMGDGWLSSKALRIPGLTRVLRSRGIPDFGQFSPVGDSWSRIAHALLDELASASASRRPQQVFSLTPTVGAIRVRLTHGRCPIRQEPGWVSFGMPYGHVRKGHGFAVTGG